MERMPYEPLDDGDSIIKFYKMIRSNYYKHLKSINIILITFFVALIITNLVFIISYWNESKQISSDCPNITVWIMAYSTVYITYIVTMLPTNFNPDIIFVPIGQLFLTGLFMLMNDLNSSKTSFCSSFYVLEGLKPMYNVYIVNRVLNMIWEVTIGLIICLIPFTILTLIVSRFVKKNEYELVQDYTNVGIPQDCNQQI